MPPPTPTYSTSIYQYTAPSATEDQSKPLPRILEINKVQQAATGLLTRMLDSIPQPRSAGVTASTTQAEVRARSKEELRRRAKAVFTALDQQSHDASTMGSVGTTTTTTTTTTTQ